MSLVSIKLDPKEVLGAITAAQERQVPFALKKALTAVALDAQNELRRLMPLVFDRPTEFVKRGVRIIPAKRQDGTIVALVYIADETVKGASAEKSLRAEILGGGREDKRSEEWLREKNLLPAGAQTARSRFAPLDAYGNLQRGVLIKALSRLRAIREAGFTMNETRRSRVLRQRRLGVTSAFFIGRPEQRGRTGVWERIETTWGSAVRPLLYFIRAPRYEPKLKMADVVAKVVRQKVAERFLEAWNELLKKTN